MATFAIWILSSFTGLIGVANLYGSTTESYFAFYSRENSYYNEAGSAELGSDLEAAEKVYRQFEVVFWVRIVQLMCGCCAICVVAMAYMNMQDSASRSNGAEAE